MTALFRYSPGYQLGPWKTLDLALSSELLGFGGRYHLPFGGHANTFGGSGVQTCWGPNAVVGDAQLSGYTNESFPWGANINHAVCPGWTPTNPVTCWAQNPVVTVGTMCNGGDQVEYYPEFSEWDAINFRTGHTFCMSYYFSDFGGTNGIVRVWADDDPADGSRLVFDASSVDTKGPDDGHSNGADTIRFNNELSGANQSYTGPPAMSYMDNIVVTRGGLPVPCDALW